MTTTRATRFRWIVIILLFAITMVDYIDRASISFTVDEISKTFNFSEEQIGWILGAFGGGYVVTTLLGGVLVDRYGARIVLTITVLFWSVSLLLTGLATGFLMIFLARTLLGLAEGPNFPGMTRAIGDWLSPVERSKAIAYSLVAVPLALAVGSPIVAQLVVHLTWRGMFFVLAGTALLWVPFWWCLFRNFPEKSKRVNALELAKIHQGEAAKLSESQQHKQRQQIQGLWKFLFSNKTLLANYWAFFVFGYFLFFFMGWLPTYLSDHYHEKLAAVGYFSILPWLLGALMLWATGHLSDFILRKTGRYRWSRSYPIWISQLLAAICIIPIVLAHRVDMAVLYISLAVGFIMSANASYFATNIDVAKARAGTALGITDAAFAIAGIVSPIVTGWIATVTGHFESAFWVLFALALSSVVIVFAFHHPDKAKKLVV